MIRDHKKFILWGALLVWLAAAAAGYLYYRRTINAFDGRLAEQLRMDVSEKSDGPYTEALTLIREISSEKGGFVALGEEKPLQEYVHRSTGNIPDLIYLDVVAHDGRVLARAGDGPPPVKKRITVMPESPETPAVDIDHLGSGDIAERFAADVVFFGQKVGRVQVILSSPTKDPSGRYFSAWLGWTATVPVLLFLLLLAVHWGETAYRVNSARKVFIALMALDLFWRERKARRKIQRMAVIHHIWTQETTKTRQARLDIEERIGPYVLKQRIGRGGMAELFIAEKTRENDFRMIVALKRILPHLADDPEFTMRFIREARIAALLQHSNIVATNDFGKYDNSYIIAMEYVRGLNLGEIMTRLKKRLDMAQAVYIAAQICRGLHYSHTKSDDTTGEPLNIVHRDISPQNIMISYEGEVKISDFGIAKAALFSGFTQAGAIVGKLSYMSPEQVIAGETVDCRTDIYALGIVLYELLSGSPLFRFGSAVQAIAEIPKTKVRPIGKLAPDIPDELGRIVMKALEKDKNRRYPTALAFLDDLEALKREFSITYGMTDLSNFMKRHFSLVRPAEDSGIPPSHFLKVLQDILL